MARIHLVEGPVGAGKSTYSKKISERYAAPHFNLDEWMARLFLPDRPEIDTMIWYLERKERCSEQIWQAAIAVLNAGNDVVLELGLIQRESRQAFYKQSNEAGHEVHVYVLDADRDIRRERVQVRNMERGATFSMNVPDHIFELASDRWEEPDNLECVEQNVLFVPHTG